MSNDNLRKHSSQVVDGIECAPARAMLRAVGFTDEDFKKPQIGIASTWANNCQERQTTKKRPERHRPGLF